MSWLRRLFNPKADEPAPPQMERIAITFTEEEEAAISKQQREVDSFAPEPGQVMCFSPEMANAMMALGLVKYVREQLGIADRVPAAEFPAIIEKIIKTQAKATALHSLPYYFYIWAVLNEEKDMETAKRLHTLFLSKQASFKPNIVDKWIIQYINIEGWYSVEEAIEEAQKMIAK
jgi:hypothetical protein